jgi:GTP-binding protein EngB required for normal cell division
VREKQQQIQAPPQPASAQSRNSPARTQTHHRQEEETPGQTRAAGANSRNHAEERDRQAHAQAQHRCEQEMDSQRQAYAQAQQRHDQEIERQRQAQAQAQQRHQQEMDRFRQLDAQQQAERNRQLQQREQDLAVQRSREVAEAARLQKEEQRLMREIEALSQRERQKQELIAREWPRPDWLPTNSSLHFAVTGRSGTGKSSLVNAILNRKPSHPEAAPIGVNETTKVPTCYKVKEGPLTGVCLEDLPGAGTPTVPEADYIKRFGLRYFSALFIVTAGRFTETDAALFDQACSFRLPCYLLRTKADEDIRNNEDDLEMEPQQTLNQLRTSTLSALSNLLSSMNQGGGVLNYQERVFVVTTKARRYENYLKPEFERLLTLIQEDLKTAWEIVDDPTASAEAWFAASSSSSTRPVLAGAVTDARQQESVPSAVHAAKAANVTEEANDVASAAPATQVVQHDDSN